MPDTSENSTSVSDSAKVPRIVTGVPPILRPPVGTNPVISGEASQLRMRRAAIRPCCHPASRSDDAVMLYMGGGAYHYAGPPQKVIDANVLSTLV